MLSASTAATPVPIDSARARRPRLRDLWRHRRLALQLVKRDVEARYRGSALGLFWSFLHPLFLLGIYTYVFGVVFKARWGGAVDTRLSQFALVLFCGLIPFNLFAECVGRSPSLIINSANYVKKVVFPLEILPVVALGGALFNTVVSLIILIVAHIAMNATLSWTLLQAPLVLLPLVLLTLGIGWMLASLGVFLRDLTQVIGLAVQALFFMTPIFYPPEAVPTSLRNLMILNPLSAVVENFRRVVLWGRMPDWAQFAGSLAIGGVVMLLGHAWFMKTKRAFADVI